MAVYTNAGGGGGASSDELTAARGDVLKGKTAVTSDSSDEPAEGTLELTGDAAVLIEQHRGISAYSEQTVCIKANFGTVCVEGEGLTIRMMDREKLIVYGMIRALRLERQKP